MYRPDYSSLEQAAPTKLAYENNFEVEVLLSEFFLRTSAEVGRETRNGMSVWRRREKTVIDEGNGTNWRWPWQSPPVRRGFVVLGERTCLEEDRSVDGIREISNVFPD
jgi:hypothetical protein